jgi:hypothetical protein
MQRLSKGESEAAFLESLDPPPPPRVIEPPACAYSLHFCVHAEREKIERERGFTNKRADLLLLLVTRLKNPAHSSRLVAVVDFFFWQRPPETRLR